MTTLTALHEALRPLGLRCLGVLGKAALETLKPAERPEGARTLALIGIVGSEVWPVFARALARPPVANHENPLDAWSVANLTPVAERLGARAVFPFSAAPLWPFQRWALATGAFFPSPIKMLIHSRYGLWSSFRAAFAFHEEIAMPDAPATGESPCSRCLKKPCLATCPVGAFSAEAYNVQSCRAHVRTAASACATLGCLARRACPVAADLRHSPAHAAFHMRAFAPH